MKNTLKFILIYTIIPFVWNKTIAQNNYLEIKANRKSINQGTIDKIKSLGFTNNYDFYTNNYFLVKKDDYTSLSDSLGNIVNLPVKRSVIFNPTKKGIIFTSDESQNLHSHSAKSFNIQSFNLKGEKNKIQISDLNSYFFAFGTKHTAKQYFTDSGDYITIHKETNNETHEGLLQDNGILILEAKYESINHIGSKYFSVKKDGFYYIFDALKKTFNPIKFEDIKINEYDGEAYFYGKNIMKQNNKYGLYDLTLNKWIIANSYDKLELITDSFIKDQQTPKARNLKVIYTDMYIAEKDKKIGVINHQNQIIVPIIYTKIEYSRDYPNSNYFTVYNEQNKHNYYDLTSKKEVLKSFYNEIYFDNKNKELLFGRVDKYWTLVNPNTNEIYISETEKIVKILFEDFKPCFYLEFEDGTKGLGSYEAKKIIVNKEKYVSRVNDCRSYFNITNSEYKNYIIDSNGNILVPPLKSFSGAVKLQKGHFVIYNYNKPDKIFNVYNNKGEEVDKKEFMAK